MRLYQIILGTNLWRRFACIWGAWPICREPIHAL